VGGMGRRRASDSQGAYGGEPGFADYDCCLVSLANLVRGRGGWILETAALAYRSV
jgi:hypothetical protein